MSDVIDDSVNNPSAKAVTEQEPAEVKPVETKNAESNTGSGEQASTAGTRPRMEDLPSPKELLKNVRPEDLPEYYVALGASAGGLEALQEVFENLPDDTDAAFIVIQHLSPDYKSMMSELLSKNTAMPIHEVVEDSYVVKKNTVYLIPARKSTILAEGTLLLSDEMPDNLIKTPINTCFKSVAEDQQHKAIGVVLSGTGSDGTQGIVAIKKTGGLTMVQEPGSAKFDGMPQNAINTGLVDLVLTPKDIAQHIARYCEVLPAAHSTESKDLLAGNEQLMQDIFDILKKKHFIDFLDYKHSTIARRIERRMHINQLDDLQEYRDLLYSSSKELQILSRELLIGVTHFFRDKDPFKYLQDRALPELLDNTPEEGALRIWVAGCSTGEEAYSIAILVDQLLKQRKQSRVVKIFATDVDNNAISDASAGVFSSESVEDIRPDWLEMYFAKTPAGYVVSGHIRQMIIFATHNMICDPPFSNIDLVSCRNTLIYFQHAAQRKVLSALHFALKKNGLLFLGSSESLGELQSYFETLDERSKIYRKNSTMRVAVGNALPSARKEGSSATVHARQAMKPVSQVLQYHRNLDRSSSFAFIKDRLIERFIPFVMILNEEFEVLHIYGQSDLFLRPMPKGQVNTLVQSLVVESLQIPVSTALHRAQKEQSSVHYTEVLVTTSKEEQLIAELMVEYHTETAVPSAPVFYTVNLVPQHSADGSPQQVTSDVLEKNTGSQGIPFNIYDQAQQRIRDLEQELVKKQECLQVTVEELETTNEELQSANEELMSANEELQSTNEELQSVNEELYTVNSEYQQKIAELTIANNDVKHALQSTNVGLIFLDEELCLRKYTQIAVEYVNILDSDLGRPFSHISRSLDYQELDDDIRKVHSGAKTIEKKIDVPGDRVLLVRIVPYSAEHVTPSDKGVVVTLTDITQLH